MRHCKCGCKRQISKIEWTRGRRLLSGCAFKYRRKYKVSSKYKMCAWDAKLESINNFKVRGGKHVSFCIKHEHINWELYKNGNLTDSHGNTSKTHAERCYGINEYALLKKQKNKCAICGFMFKTTKYARGKRVDFRVDHDHKTGKIRGLLCNDCNSFLGRIKDNPQALVQYLIAGVEKSRL